MRMRMILAALLALAGGGTLLHAGPAFDGAAAKALVDSLCRPEFAGRKSGDPGACLAEHWAAAQFVRWGLKPAPGGGHLQYFPLLNCREERAELELVNGYHGKRRYVNGEDFHLCTNSGSLKGKVEVVFAGYGIAEPGKGWDDFAGLDVRGKAVVMYKAAPGPERLWETELTRDYKVRAARERGAAVALFFNTEAAISGAAIHQEAYDPDFPVMMVSPHLVADLLRGTGRELDEVKENLKTEPQSFPTGKTLKLNVRTRRNPQASAANVIGVLPGSDPRLKDEWIVVGGHLDHNGINASGDVFYGADDNASGAAVVMELARAFAAGPPPRRSLMFVAFAGEEQGLLGSEWFVAHPSVPLDRIAAMANFDCCGLGRGAGFGGAEFFPGLWDEYYAGLDSTLKADLTVSNAWGHGSDNHPFHRHGIPAFNYWSSGSSRPFYHHQEDLPGMIPASTLGAVGTAAADFLAWLADREDPLTTPHRRALTRLTTALAVDLEPVLRTSATDDSALAEELRSRRKRGLKGAAVAIRSSDPCGDLQAWREFAETHGFLWAEGPDGVRQAKRRQTLALLPVIHNPLGMVAHGVSLHHLKAEGVRTVILHGDVPDSARAAAWLGECEKEGMLLVYSPGSRWAPLVPEQARRVLTVADWTGESLALAPDDTPPYDQKSVRLAMTTGDLAPDPAGVADKAVWLPLTWTAEGQAAAFERIEALEEAGFSGQQVTWMLGENLLEVMGE